MPLESAISFDRKNDFQAFLTAEPVGAARWLAAVIAAASARGTFADMIAGLLADAQPDAAKITARAKDLAAMGKALTGPPSAFSADQVRTLGLTFADVLPPPMLRGSVKAVPTTRELGLRLVLNVGQREYPLVCNDDALECFTADLSAFAGAYDVAIVGWPDEAGQIHGREAAPVMQLDGLTWRDWAQGRLFDNGTAGEPVVLRINAQQQITIADTAVQEKLRPFIGTGVVLYGKRVTGEGGSVSLATVHPKSWFLTRLTNPADPAVNYPGAPRPILVGDRALCIGATPPWNWQGPNIETHIIAPGNAASMSGTEERRVVFGEPAAGLPEGWPNPVNHVTRVIAAITCADAPISSPAHIATRRAPRGALITGLRGIAEVTSAELAFSGA
jgi:hypothetical protein